jgi:lipid II:glycine glycyltransferase (peptidoglycan interpeptide bridge formation enzyme)
VGSSPKLLNTFLTLNKETAVRDRFAPHDDVYYKKQIETTRNTEMMYVYVAEAMIDGVLQPIAANIVSHFGKRVTYVHGASGNRGRNLMAPFLLQWSAILEAKRVGATEYDFWGIADSEDPTHPWAGITRFKRGFGGSMVQYIGAYDIIYKPTWYKIYRAYKTLRK